MPAKKRNTPPDSAAKEYPFANFPYDSQTDIFAGIDLPKFAANVTTIVNHAFSEYRMLLVNRNGAISELGRRVGIVIAHFQWNPTLEDSTIAEVAGLTLDQVSKGKRNLITNGILHKPAKIRKGLNEFAFKMLPMLEQADELERWRPNFIRYQRKDIIDQATDVANSVTSADSDPDLADSGDPDVANLATKNVTDSGDVANLATLYMYITQDRDDDEIDPDPVTHHHQIRDPGSPAQKVANLATSADSDAADVANLATSADSDAADVANLATSIPDYLIPIADFLPADTIKRIAAAGTLGKWGSDAANHAVSRFLSEYLLKGKDYGNAAKLIDSIAERCYRQRKGAESKKAKDDELDLYKHVDGFIKRRGVKAKTDDPDYQKELREGFKQRHGFYPPD